MITFTDTAVNHLKGALDPGEIVRVAVMGGGCSGMSYSLSVETEFDEDDFLIEYGEVKVYVDSTQLVYFERYNGRLCDNTAAARI